MDGSLNGEGARLRFCAVMRPGGGEIQGHYLPGPRGHILRIGLNAGGVIAFPRFTGP
jgi:hypothetical protein